MSHLRAPKTQPHRISLREVSFPCQFICRYCFFYLLCLTYFTEGGGGGGGGGGVRADSNLSILNEAKKNYMGQFIFSRGVGVYLLILFAYSYAKKKIHMFLWPCSLAVPVLAGWVYAFCGSVSRNSRRLNWQ